MTGELTNITCTFAFPTYHNAENQWCCYKYRDRETDKEFVAIGINLPKVRNLPVQLVGHWAMNKKTGKKQFEVEYAEQARITSKSEVIAYFVSLKCGIGKAKAAAIYRKFGDKTWDILDRNPEELKKVPGISDKVYNRLLDAVKASNISRELLRLFAKAGITVSGNTLHALVEKLGHTDFYSYGIDEGGAGTIRAERDAWRIAHEAGGKVGVLVVVVGHALGIAHLHPCTQFTA